MVCVRGSSSRPIMQQHVESFLRSLGRTGSSHGDKEAKVSKLSDEDDREAYLRVAPQLTGRAQRTLCEQVSHTVSPMLSTVHTYI